MLDGGLDGRKPQELTMYPYDDENKPAQQPQKPQSLSSKVEGMTGYNPQLPGSLTEAGEQFAYGIGKTGQEAAKLLDSATYYPRKALGSAVAGATDFVSGMMGAGGQQQDITAPSPAPHQLLMQGQLQPYAGPKSKNPAIDRLGEQMMTPQSPASLGAQQRQPMPQQKQPTGGVPAPRRTPQSLQAVDKRLGGGFGVSRSMTDGETTYVSPQGTATFHGEAKGGGGVSVMGGGREGMERNLKAASILEQDRLQKEHRRAVTDADRDARRYANMAEKNPKYAKLAEASEAKLQSLMGGGGVAQQELAASIQQQGFRDEQKRLGQESQAKLAVESAKALGKEGEPEDSTLFTQEREKASAKKFAEIRESIPGAVKTLESLRQLQSQLQSGDVDTGPISNVLAEGDRLIGGAFGKAAEKDKFQSIANMINLAGTKQLLSGVITDRDMALIEQAGASYKKDDPVNRYLLDFYENAMERSIERFNAMDKYQQQHGTLNGFDESPYQVTLDYEKLGLGSGVGGEQPSAQGSGEREPPQKLGVRVPDEQRGEINNYVSNLIAQGYNEEQALGMAQKQFMQAGE